MKMKLVNLKLWRQIRGLTLEEMAERALISHTTVWKVENLKLEASQLVAGRFSEILDVPIVDLTDLRTILVVPTEWSEITSDPRIRYIIDVLTGYSDVRLTQIMDSLIKENNKEKE